MNASNAKNATNQIKQQFTDLKTRGQHLVGPHWQRLNQRERLIVSVAGVLLVIAAVYWLLWNPIASGIEQRKQTIAAQQETLQWTRENTGIYLAAQEEGADTTSAAAGSITQRVTQLAAAQNIEITRMQPQSDGLLVVIDTVAFSQLLTLLDALQQQGGLAIESLDVTEGPEPGVVRVRRLQVSGA